MTNGILASLEQLCRAVSVWIGRRGIGMTTTAGGMQISQTPTFYSVNRKSRIILRGWYNKNKIVVQSKPSIAHSSVVEKPSLVDKSWATNCFYVVKALNSGKPSVVDNFFSEVA